MDLKEILFKRAGELLNKNGKSYTKIERIEIFNQTKYNQAMIIWYWCNEEFDIQYLDVYDGEFLWEV